MLLYEYISANLKCKWKTDMPFYKLHLNFKFAFFFSSKQGVSVIMT